MSVIISFLFIVLFFKGFKGKKRGVKGEKRDECFCSRWPSFFTFHFSFLTFGRVCSRLEKLMRASLSSRLIADFTPRSARLFGVKVSFQYIQEVFLVDDPVEGRDEICVLPFAIQEG